MSVYSVYEPSGVPADLAARADRLVFVKDGFCWPALFVPALWLIYHRMWLELVIFLAVFTVPSLAFGIDPQTETLYGWIGLALVVLFAFMANDLRGAALERRGYRLIGVAMGDSRDEAELSFFHHWLSREAKTVSSEPAREVRPRPRRVKTVLPPAGAGEEVIGLFPRP